MKNHILNGLAGCLLVVGLPHAMQADEAAAYGTQYDHSHWGNSDNHYCGDDNCYWGSQDCFGWNFAAAVDFLWWRACQDLVIGVTDTGRNTQPASITDGTTRFYHFNYQPGVRISLAAEIPCSDWTVAAVYTRFHQDTHNTTTPDLGGGIWASLLPPWLPDEENGLADEAHSSLNLKYDMVDVLFSAAKCCGNWVGRPYAGGRFLLLNQKYEVNYKMAPGGEGQPSSIVTAKWRTYFPAGGLTAGYEGVYHVDCGFGVLARLGASLLGGDAKSNQQWLTSEAQPTLAQSGNRSKHCQFIWGWDAKLGFTYDIPCDCHPIELAVGYEIQDWWNMPNQRIFSDANFPGVNISDGCGRLTLHGLFVRVGTTF